MATILHIAGHGKNKNGSFDPGARGYITQGEHRYYAQSFFDKLKKYEPKGHVVFYHIAYNVYDYGDIVALARKYGSNVIVIEWHFDAASASATGGHVIVHSSFAPDKVDLGIRDGIKDMVGVRYNHKGQTGISGRNNLANVNRTANAGINYRLVELGFGTSSKDSSVMLNQMDQFAERVTEGIFNVQIDGPQQQDSMAGYYVVKSGDTLWGIAQDFGVKVAEVKSWNNLSSDLIFPGQSLKVEGSDTPAPAPEPKPAETPQATSDNSIDVGDWVRVPANKLYFRGNDENPVKSDELSAQIETIDNSWKNPLRLVKYGSAVGFARPSDINGGTDNKPTSGKKYNLPNAEYWVKSPQFSGSGVRTVQEALASIYYYPDKGAKNDGVDGYYGPNTADAVKRFQSMYGLKADGIYGAATRAKLDSLVN